MASAVTSRPSCAITVLLEVPLVRSSCAERGFAVRPQRDARLSLVFSAKQTRLLHKNALGDPGNHKVDEQSRLWVLLAAMGIEASHLNWNRRLVF